ncbi:pectin lyase fold/virulence factor [Aspergillus undulatus]|uniref:pectin lyase fold/virulence factor n=1 Tax=Aspergillus undulatus TaxID=1810928 RepID=UPI003CCCBD31
MLLPTALATSKTCTIPANGNSPDDALTTIEAFSTCKKDSTIIFANTTYNIGTVLDLQGPENVLIDIKGRLDAAQTSTTGSTTPSPIGPGVDQSSYPPAAYQNQTTAMILGGKNLYAWYDFANGESNYPGRPHMIVITAQDSTFHGLRFVQPQMWTVIIVSSNNLLLSDIYVKAKSTSRAPARNIDGANTLFSADITFRRWEIGNGDDSTVAKANSTDILGVAIGSIGQYYNEFEIVENVLVRNITQVENGKQTPLVVSQCYTNVAQMNCSTSAFEIWGRSAGGCDGITMDNVVFWDNWGEELVEATGVRCSNVNEPVGFECDRRSMAMTRSRPFAG